MCFKCAVGEVPEVGNGGVGRFVVNHTAVVACARPADVVEQIRAATGWAKYVGKNDQFGVGGTDSLAEVDVKFVPFVGFRQRIEYFNRRSAAF